jgi:hypothetical protein
MLDDYNFVSLSCILIDSLVVVQAITSNGHGSWIGRSLVEQIRRLLALDWQVVVHH